MICMFSIGGLKNVSSRASTLLLRMSKLTLLPMAATGSGGPSPRTPPSERYDTSARWLAMERYIQASVVGQVDDKKAC